MIKLDDLNLVDILPDNLKQDEVTLAIAEVANDEFKRLLEEIEILNPQTATPAFALDMVAYEEHVDFYDITLPEEIKRELIAKSEHLHRIKGTPAAVEELITTVFGEGKVVEWFEYGGQPFRFKVVTSNPSVTLEKADQFIRALDSVKRKSARLEKVEITQTEDMSLFFGGVLHIGDKLEIKQVI